MRRTYVYAVAGAALGTAGLLTLFGVGENPSALTDAQALVLGLVQGLTELLPISSSGHLILVPWGADWTYLEEHDSFNQTFDVALHLGTLIAVGAYFWSDIERLVKAFFRSLGRRKIETSDERIAWFVLVATIPAGLAGLLGEDLIARHLGEPWQIAVLLTVGAGVLYWADSSPQTRAMGDLASGMPWSWDSPRLWRSLRACRAPASPSPPDASCAWIATAPRASRFSCSSRQFSAQCS